MKFQVDLVSLVFKLIEGKLCILVEKVSAEDLIHCSLPTVPFALGLSAEETISKSIGEFGVSASYVEQLYTFPDGENGSIKMAYIVLSDPLASKLPKPDGGRGSWISAKRVPKLFGIHSHIKDVGMQRLRNKISYSRIATRLLGDEFTLTELLKVYEEILGEPVDKRNFRKQVEAKKLVAPTDKYRHGTHRPARLYRRGPKSKNVPL